MSARENIVKNIESQLRNMQEPTPGLVSRNFFDIQKLAITQFPAILIVTSNEVRSDISVGEREAELNINIRCYLRGNELDTLRNQIVEAIEEVLEISPDRDITLSNSNIHAVTTDISQIEVVEREPPLAEVVVTLLVTYRYKKGVL